MNLRNIYLPALLTGLSLISYSPLTIAATVADTSCVGSVDSDDIKKTLTDTKLSKTEKLAAIDGYFVEKAQLARKTDYQKAMKLIMQDAIGVTGITDLSSKLADAAVEACAKLNQANSLTVENAAKAGCAKAELTCQMTLAVIDEPEGGNSKYSLYLGNVYSLEATGKWHSAGEVSLVSRTSWSGNKSNSGCRNDTSNTWSISCGWVGTFEATYSSLGKLDTDDQQTFNPFSSSNGIYRTNLAAEWVGKKHPWYGFTAGLGFTTYPKADTDTDTNVDARTRQFYGVLALADYGNNDYGKVTGRIFIGYAKDKFWEWTDDTNRQHDESDRYVLDTRIDAPGIFDSNKVRLSLRMYADLPTSGEGPNDVRISLLLNVNLGKLFQFSNE